MIFVVLKPSTGRRRQQRQRQQRQRQRSRLCTSCRLLAAADVGRNTQQTMMLCAFYCIVCFIFLIDTCNCFHDNKVLTFIPIHNRYCHNNDENNNRMVNIRWRQQQRLSTNTGFPSSSNLRLVHYDSSDSISSSSSSSSSHTSTIRPTPSRISRTKTITALSMVASSASSSLPSTSSTEQLRQHLESLTVKQLRQLLKESSLNVKGISSKLKLKRDLVNYLEQNLHEKDGTDSSSSSNNNTPKISETSLSSSSSLPKKKTTGPLRMPSIQSSSRIDSTTSSSEEDDDDGSTTTTTTTKKQPLSPKDTIFERVYQQYPPLLTDPLNCTGDGDNDIRQTYHPIFANNPEVKGSDMDIVFVGTASCTPGITRGVSCTGLRLNWKRRSFHHEVPNDGTTAKILKEASSSFMGGTWLFDCGECTQLQVQRTPAIKPSKITKIFITHAHGDHSFGLPGLLCLMGQDRDRENAPPVEIYGPEGLRMWLRVAIRYSVSRIVPPYRVHELKDIPMAPEWVYIRRPNRYFYKGFDKSGTNEWGIQGLAGEDPQSWISRANMMNLDRSAQYGEIDGGRDIFPIYDHPRSSDNAPVWEVEDEEDVKVFAAPMSHGIPCLGYVIEEQSRPGRLRNEFVKPIVQRNLKALKEAGFTVPMKAMAVIKNLPVGSAFTFPDGTVVTQAEAVEPPRKGRKIVLCGDTASSRAIQGLAMDADAVIHEATNSFLTGVDKDTNLRTVTKDAIVHGHSTPYMAGEFAKRVRAKRLLLNHFSARYKGDQTVDSISIMTRLEGQAMKASGLNSTSVAAAWDMMVLPIPQN